MFSTLAGLGLKPQLIRIWYLLAQLKGHHILQFSGLSVKSRVISICHSCSLLGAHHIFHLSVLSVKLRVNSLLPLNGTIMSSPYFPCQRVKSLNGELIPICHLLALVGSHQISHVSGLMFKRRVNSHLPFAFIIRSSLYFPRQQDKGLNSK